MNFSNSQNKQTLRSYGMLIKGRSASSDSYRYGFQGQEKDDEVKGEGNSVNYKYRMHDPRVGRFFAVDPLAGQFVWNSPYSFSANRVIDKIELEGAETAEPSYMKLSGGYTTAIDAYSAYNITESTIETALKPMPDPPRVFSQATIDIPYGDKQRMAQANNMAEMTGLDNVVGVAFGRNHTGEVNRLASLGFLAFDVFGGKVIAKIGKGALEIGGKLVKNWDDFYKASSKLDIPERVAKFKQIAPEVAEQNGWVPNKSLMKKNKGRKIWSDKDGMNYSLDTQHGTFEVTTKKGKHVGELKFSGELDITKQDPSGGHDLIVK